MDLIVFLQTSFHENPWYEKRLPANLAGPVTLSSE